MYTHQMSGDACVCSCHEKRVDDGGWRVWVGFELVFLPLPFYDTVVKETEKETVNIRDRKGGEMER